MTASPDAATPEVVAAAIAGEFHGYIDRFAAVTRRAADRFARRDWRGHREDATERLDLYAKCVDAVVERISLQLGERLADREVWSAIRAAYPHELGETDAPEIAETFFNSVTRRIFHTRGVDDAIEFVSPGEHEPQETPVRHVAAGPLEAVLIAVLEGAGIGASWQNLTRDVRLAADELRRYMTVVGVPEQVRGARILDTVFYRGQGAYLVGELDLAAATLPFALAVHHTTRGLTVGAVLPGTDDLSVLFSYTRAAFHVQGSPGPIVAALSRLMPHRRRAELYAAVGHHKHGKTELYRDLMRHVATTQDRFVRAPGIPGMVMIVFTLPGYDVVFKVIRDRFPYPKQTTRRQIVDRYRLVFRHDRAGRLIDAQEFEHLRFPKERFDPAVLEELAEQAKRSVTIGDDAVVLHHAYVERRVTPLDIYVRESNPIKAAAAIVDYGRAIKNLAASNIFPGDMLLKNFGVTRSGRVVFYDYDELTLLTQCNFREIPDTDDPDDAMAADAWFGVGPDDVFPEEFPRFLGLRGELRDVFMHAHGDLFGVRFWRRMQQRIESGEIIEVFPYPRERRLGANIRRRRPAA